MLPFRPAKAFAAAARSCRRSIHEYYSRTYTTHAQYKTEPKKGDKVVVGVSGGVDSSVAALLLSQKDYDLSAVFMRNWDTADESGTDKGCEWEKDWEDVQLVCRKLDIPCSLTDLSKEYWNRVFAPALEQWEMGVSPNTDVWCNKEIKFGALLARLPPDSSGQQPWFATGHYARKGWSEPSHTHNSSHRPRPKLLRPTDGNKDQTYFLASIPEPSLQRALFPLSHLRKHEVRELAKKHGLHNAERPDSVGICFVGEKAKFNRWLSNYIPPQEGLIIDETTGKTLGKHEGLWKYTIGEASRLPGMPTRMPVSRKDAEANTIYVVPGMNNEALLTNTIRVPSFSWIWGDSTPPQIDTSEGFRAGLKHRYRMPDTPCTVHRSSDGSGGLTIRVDQPEQAVTPGQVAVLYDGEWCLGCGVIESSEMVR